MKLIRTIVLLTFLMGLLLPPRSPARAAASLELYGTFHAMGVIITIDDTDDPDGDAIAAVEYRTGGETYQAGFPLSRIADTRFAGSLFWLEPGTIYDVRVTFSDPDGGPLDGVTVDAAASTRAEIVIPGPENSYYVSPTGSGSACTLAAPCPLTEGLSQAQPGDEVILRDGVYAQGEIDLPRSGASGAPIVIRGYAGETAILDGGHPASFTWTAQGGGVYHTTVDASDTHLVAADGERLYPYQTLSDLQSLSWGIPGFYADGTALYVRLAEDADPNSAAMVVSRYNHAFYVKQDYVYFLDLTFRHYGQGSWAKAIYFDDASDNLVQGCTFAINDLGIGIKRDSHRNVIQDNEFYDTDFMWPWEAVKGGSSLETGGVSFYSPTTGRGNIIRRNTFHDYFDGFCACPNETGGETNETDVYENLVYNIGDDGMETDGTCSNVRIWGNTFHDVLMGISLAPVYDGPVYAIRNLIYRTGVGNNDYTGSPFKFNSGYDQSGPMYLFHNTADAALPGNNGIYIKAPGTWQLIYARNNIWSGTDYALNNYNETQPIDFDYDDLYTTNPDEFVYWGSGPDRHMHDLAIFQSSTGQETHGFDVEPGFADSGSGDYTLDSASDLIDAGIAIPGINDDYVGSAPDVGAFEYADSGFTLSATPSSRSIEPGESAEYLVGVESIGGFANMVTLTAASPSLSLTVSLSPTTIDPPGQATLTITSTHSISMTSGSWYTIPITATGGGVTRTTSAGLLVGGERAYLPLVVRSLVVLGETGGASIAFGDAPEAGGSTPGLVNTSISQVENGSIIFFQEYFDDHDFGSRGWYDNTNLRLSTVEHIPGSTNSVEFHFDQGATTPTSGSAIRRKFVESDEIYVSYYVKYSSNWEGSNRSYHPHEFLILTNLDSDWIGPAYTHMTAYIEQNEGEPLLATQDGQNIDESNIGVDLTNITEERAVAGCNGDSDGYGEGSCYLAGSVHRNGKSWRAGGVYFADTPGSYYKNDWHFVETYFKLNSISAGKGIADGVIRYWYDDQLIIDHDDVVLRTGQHPDMKFDQFMIAPWIGDGSPVDQTFWVDDLTVATLRPSAEPGLTLNGTPANQSIRLTWTVTGTLPVTSTWQIAYDGPAGDPPSPISGIISPTRAYTLTGLTNYTWYTVTLNGMLGSTPFLTDTVRVMSTDISVYLPLVLRAYSP